MVIQPPTLQEEAIRNIKKLIIEGNLKLGSRINEVEVSAHLNISRGPVRESLRILQQEGLVTYVPRKGMFVTELKEPDIHEIYNIRFHLEKNAIELGYDQLTDKHINQFEQLIEKMKFFSLENRKDMLVQLDHDFHELIINLPNYHRLKKNWESYNALIELIFAQVFELGSEKVEDLPQSHEILVDVLKERNKEKFIKVLESHYFQGKENLLAVWN